MKAVALVTKQAFTYVFDRVSGEPVWPIVERPVPASDVPGERAAATQPFPTKPPAFDRQGMTLDDVIDFTPAIRARAVEALKGYRLGAMYQPPSLAAAPDGTKGTILLPGVQGGAQWEHGAADPETGLLYVGSATQPSLVALEKSDESDMDYVAVQQRGAADRGRAADRQAAVRPHHRHRSHERRASPGRWPTATRRRRFATIRC